MTNASELHDESSEGVKISDKRRIDPQTGQPRDESAAEQNSGETSLETPDKVSELTADLQRITAEYANYRKRVDRDRELIRDMSTSVALEQLIIKDKTLNELFDLEYGEEAERECIGDENVKLCEY